MWKNIQNIKGNKNNIDNLKADETIILANLNILQKEVNKQRNLIIKDDVISIKKTYSNMSNENFTCNYEDFQDLCTLLAKTGMRINFYSGIV